jgi:hypothetical protein
VHVSETIVPVFDIQTTHCLTAVGPLEISLDMSSQNGIGGTWEPSVITTNIGTHQYVFTPYGGQQCAVPLIVSVTSYGYNPPIYIEDYVVLGNAYTGNGLYLTEEEIRARGLCDTVIDIPGVDSHGCPTLTVLTLTIGTVGLTDYTNVHFNIYPNPATDILHIDAKDFDNIIIYDIIGNEIIRNGKDTKINISNLSSGVYFVNLMSDSKIIGVKQLIKQ